MIKKNAVAVLFSFLAFSNLNSAPNNFHRNCEGFLPPNTLSIPVGSGSGLMAGGKRSGLSESMFNEIIDKFEKKYAAEFAKYGATLQVNRLWEESRVNASARQLDNVWILDMYGGLARHPQMTYEAFQVVLCHEAGHHLGGLPIKSTSAWATTEGGADYFATLKCLRRLVVDDSRAALVIKRSRPHPLALKRCKKQFARGRDRMACLYAAKASEAVIRFVKAAMNDVTPARFTTPDLSVTKVSFDRYASTQCRLDTFFAGAICPADHLVALSKDDERSGACIEEKDKFGWRPRCWFAPEVPGPQRALDASEGAV